MNKYKKLQEQIEDLKEDRKKKSIRYSVMIIGATIITGIIHSKIPKL